MGKNCTRSVALTNGGDKKSRTDGCKTIMNDSEKNEKDRKKDLRWYRSGLIYWLAVNQRRASDHYRQGPGLCFRVRAVVFAAGASSLLLQIADVIVCGWAHVTSRVSPLLYNQHGTNDLVSVLSFTSIQIFRDPSIRSAHKSKDTLPPIAFSESMLFCIGWEKYLSAHSLLNPYFSSFYIGFSFIVSS